MNSMNSYEVALIVRPEVEEDAQKELIERLSQILSAEGGQVENVESWGRRRLAYPINKVTEGYYYFIQGRFSTTVLPEIDRTIKLSEGVLRHMVIRPDL
ncbi:MAG: 30S ribosomal protein S6 [Anaerolineae bacterium]|nr:30S ribosomal protein S6 [Anaerolineae bacterium]